MTQFSERPKYEIGRVIERTFGVVGHNIGPFLAFSVPLAGIPAALLAWAQYEQARSGPSFGGAWVVYWLVGMALWVVFSLMLQGALLKGALDDLDGGKARIGEMFQAAVRNLPVLFGIGVLLFFMMMIGLTLLVIPGLIVLVLFAAAGPAAVGEGAGVFGSLGRSLKLTQGNRWAVFATGLVFFAIGFLFNLVATALIIGGGAAAGLDIRLMSMVLNPVISVAAAVIFSVAYAVQYHELRAVREGAGSRNVASVFE